MDFFGKYQSPFGYQNGDNGVDSYGVDHSGFSTQDELQFDISDVNKHQYVSCIGSTDGLLATAETLAGGLYKEMQDTKDKIADPQKRVAYGGILGVLGDAKKDLKNDFIGATAGYIAGRYNVPETCNLLLSNPIKFEK